MQAIGARGVRRSREEAPSSIGQDATLSRSKDGFDSRWGYESRVSCGRMPDAVDALDLRGCSSAWLECRSVTPEVAGSSPVSPVSWESGVGNRQSEGYAALARQASSEFGSIRYSRIP